MPITKKEILEKFVKELVDDFSVGEEASMKIYVFYKAYIAREENN